MIVCLPLEFSDEGPGVICKGSESLSFDLFLRLRGG